MQKSWFWWLTTIGGVVSGTASVIAGSNLPEEVRAPAAAVALALSALLGVTHPGGSQPPRPTRE